MSPSLATAVAERLEVVAAALRTRHGGRSTITLDDEHDYQDLYGALLRLSFGDVQPEVWAPAYAGGASRVDFHLRAVGVAVELKVASAGLRARQIGEQLLVDEARYQTVADVRHLVCLVFDTRHFVDNSRGLEADVGGPPPSLASR